jgi:hypothetical protein
MFFTDEKHKKNYEYLMERYKLLPSQDVQYESTIYIASYPQIFELINQSELTSSSPLFTLTTWDETENRHTFIAPGLTGTTQRMCELALSLYNGFSVNLDEIFGAVVSQEMVWTLFQAMQIRARQSFMFKDE